MTEKKGADEGDNREKQHNEIWGNVHKATGEQKSCLLIPLDEQKLAEFINDRRKLGMAYKVLASAICQKFGRPELDEEKVAEVIEEAMFDVLGHSRVGNIKVVNKEVKDKERLWKYIKKRYAHALVSAYKKGKICR